MRKKSLKYIFVLVGVIFTLALTGCNQSVQDPDIEKTPEVVEEQVELEISEASMFLSSGETAVITANRDDVTYSVKDETVATVDSTGTVTAVAHGVTYVTATAGDYSKTCGIMVDMLGQNSYVNISGKTMKPVIYEKELIKWTVMQNWDYLSETGDYFFIQQYDTTPSDCIVTRLRKDGTETYMRMLDAGHGNNLSVEYVDDEHIYLWLNANGDESNSHTSTMRVLWEDGGVIDNNAEHIFTIEDMTYNPQVAVDKENGVVVYSLKQGTKLNIRLYDLDSMLTGDMVVLNDMQLTLGLEDGVTGYYSWQGICVEDGYIYYLEGAPGTNIYISVIDFSGQILSMELVKGYSDITYREPEGIQIIDGVVYVGIASGESGNRRASIFALK